NARSYGAAAIAVPPGREVLAAVRSAIAAAKQTAGPTVIVVPCDGSIGAPDSVAWWDVPVAAVGGDEATRRARVDYDDARGLQRWHLG
ncbi:MAG: 3D-(3,5/4)-trihydroxycyclohexane-1,2-dione acylhydrolase (decyclizing), partial [Gordonia sp. (in: high G+C Gram-positive bacteria)]